MLSNVSHCGQVNDLPLCDLDLSGHRLILGVYYLAHATAWEISILCVIQGTLFLGLDLCSTDAAQLVTTAGYDLDFLSVGDLSVDGLSVDYFSVGDMSVDDLSVDDPSVDDLFCR